MSRKRGDFRASDAGTPFARSRSNERVPGDKPMNLATAGTKLTYDDFVLFPEDGQRHELIDGEHYVSPSPKIPHQQIAGNLHWLLRRHLESDPRGQVFFAPLDVIFSRFDVVEPDLLYVSHERAEEVLSGLWVEGSPDLVIEIGSRSTRTRDETIKLQLYERAGVAEYWIVDPRTESVRVFRRGAHGYEGSVELSKDACASVTTPLLPGFAATVADIFKNARVANTRVDGARIKRQRT